ALGNGTLIRYAYDPATAHLARLRAERSRSADGVSWPTGSVHQDIGHAHDQMGNIVTLLDRTPGSGLAGAPPRSPDPSFDHDAGYRLVQASGREGDAPPADPWSSAPRSVDLTKARGYLETYAWDRAGNLLELLHDGGPTGTVRR